MAMIDVSKLTFAYDGSYDNIFENVSIRIDTDWRLGLVGRNGRGKTTFFNLLLGKYEYRGKINANVEFEYFPYEVSDMYALSADIIAEITGDVPQWKILKEMNLLDVSQDVLYRPFCTLSNGERTKLLLAAMFLKENSFLLIDEPTNHLDAQARELLGDYLAQKNGFILISHDRVFLDKCVDHILSINRANIEVQSGNFSSWWENKERRDNFEMAENERLMKDIKHLKEAARRSSEWADAAEKRKIGIDPTKVEKSLDRRPKEGKKSQKMQQRRKNLENRQDAAIEEKSKLLKNVEKCETLKLSGEKYRAQKLLEVRNAVISYDGRKICAPLSFSVEQGERVALCGTNGCGKSSMIKLILGEDISYTGDIIKGSGLKISYVPQDASFLAGDLKEYAENCGIDESKFKAILRKLNFQRVQFEKDMSDYSEGQKKKVLIARSLCESAHLYIWDEPLNFIDVISRIQIERLIEEYEPTLLFIEHDAAFCENIATKTVRM